MKRTEKGDRLLLSIRILSSAIQRRLPQMLSPLSSQNSRGEENTSHSSLGPFTKLARSNMPLCSSIKVVTPKPCIVKTNLRHHTLKRFHDP